MGSQAGPDLGIAAGLLLQGQDAVHHFAGTFHGHAHGVHHDGLLVSGDGKGHIRIVDGGGVGLLSAGGATDLSSSTVLIQLEGAGSQAGPNLGVAAGLLLQGQDAVHYLAGAFHGHTHSVYDNGLLIGGEGESHIGVVDAGGVGLAIGSGSRGLSGGRGGCGVRRGCGGGLTTAGRQSHDHNRRKGQCQELLFHFVRSPYFFLIFYAGAWIDLPTHIVR